MSDRTVPENAQIQMNGTTNGANTEGTTKIVPTYNILSLDGGGIRGYSSLFILQAIMIEVNILQTGQTSDPPTAAHPAEWVDYFVGTSTGGLSAMMLGRLNMSVQECLDAYKRLGREIFGKPRIRHIGQKIPFLWHPRSKYNHETFEKMIRAFVDERAPSHPEQVGRRNHLLEAPADSRNRTCVIATIDLPSVTRPYLFRSYDHESSEETINFGRAANIEICRVARAITAAPRYFTAMEIEDRLFVDGALGNNNPSFLAYQEIEQKHRQEVSSRVASGVLEIGHKKNIISIGTGRGKRSKLVGPSGLSRYRNFLSHVAQFAADTYQIERIMVELAQRNKDLFYKRFSVIHGMSHIDLDECKMKKRPSAPDRTEYVTLDHIEAVTREYLRTETVRASIKEAATEIFETVRAREHPSYPNRFPFRQPPQRHQNGRPR